MLYKKGGSEDKIKTNTDALINRDAKVVEEINPDKNTGRVSIDGDLWRAKSSSGELIEQNKQVIVISIESTIVTVKIK
jgi:membrane protein implicated in regulation of membrane protease activity